MDFGRGEGGANGVPRLPEEHPLTTEFLRSTPGQRRPRVVELFPPEPPEVRIGLSTWGDKRYRGTIYPSSTQPAGFLTAYGTVFSTVELSATFYGLPDEKRLETWRDAVPPSFRFMPKISQSITHRHALADAQQGLKAFMQRIDILGERVGPLLLQLPPRFAPDAVARDRLAAALAVLRRRAAVELRHPAWLADGDGEMPPAAEILRDTGAALVVTDTVGIRDVVHSILTAPVLVLRFVAAGRAAVDHPRVDAWCRRIADWLHRGLRDAYVYVHHDEPITALYLAQRFAVGLTHSDAHVHGPAPTIAISPPRSPNGRSTHGGDAAGDRDGQLSLF